MIQSDLSWIDGIRCALCLWILFLHTHLFSAPFPSNEPCMKYIREFPIIGFFATSTLAVDCFWIISGFLCQYQLYTIILSKDNGQSIISKSFWFLLNRILRLYPLYILSVLLNYFYPLSLCNNLLQLFYALFFIEMFIPSNPTDMGGIPVCQAAAWTINVDLIGYVVIIFIFIILNYINIGKNNNNNNNNINIQRRLTRLKISKTIFCILFGLSCIISCWISVDKQLSWPISIIGLESYSREKMKDTLEKNPDLPDYWTYFPDFDENSIAVKNILKRNLTYTYYLYFTGVERHGAAIFLGAILACNLLINKYKVNNKNGNRKICIYVFIQIILCLIVFYIIQDLRADTNPRHPIWSALYEKLFGILFTLLMDALLLITNEYDYNNDNDNGLFGTIGKIMSFFKSLILNLLGNKITKYLGKFTFGMYLFHSLPIGILVMTNHPIDKEKSGIGLQSYGFKYIFKTLIIGVIFSFILSAILYYIIEYPVKLFRYKYITIKYKNTLKGSPLNSEIDSRKEKESKKRQ